MCDCRWCKLSRRARRTMLNGSRPQMRKLINELMNRLCDVEDDLNYHQAILDGSWPSSVQTLTGALQIAMTKAKEREAQEHNEEAGL